MRQLSLWVAILLFGLAAGAQVKGDVVVLPIQGRVGIDMSADHRQRSIDHRFLDRMLSEVREHQPSALVLDLSSHAGDWEVVSTLIRPLTRLRNEARLIAFVRDVNGPASLLALCADDIVMRPTARFMPGSHSLSDARRLELQAHLEVTGRDRAFLTAALDPSQSLWYADGRFSNQSARSEGEEIVSNGQPMALTATHLQELGTINATAQSISEALRKLNVTGPVTTLSKEAEREHRARQKAARRVFKTYDSLRSDLRSLGELFGSITGSGLERRQAVRDFRVEMRTVIRHCRSIHRTSENSRNPLALPATIVCQAERVEQALDPINRLVRDLESGESHDAVRRHLDAARDAWKSCEDD